MSGGSQAVMQAIAAVFVQGRRTGSAVLFNDQHVITARHVLVRLDPESGAKLPVPQAELLQPR